MAEIDAEQLGELLSAYLDGELDEGDAGRVERLLRDNESARRLLNELRRTAELISSLPRHAAPSSINEDIRLQLERRELLGDVAPPHSGAGRRRSLAGSLLTVAALVGVVVVAGLWFLRGSPTTQRSGPDQRVAMAHKDRDQKAFEESLSGEIEPTAEVSTKRHGRRSTRERRSLVRRKDRGGWEKRPQRSPSGEQVKIEVETERVSPAVPSLPPQKVRAVADELARADVDRKLAAGMSLESLRTHRFAAEAVRLQVTVSDYTRRDAVAAKLIEHLKNRRITDLSGPGLSRGDRRPAGRGFFHRGAAGVNFDSQDDSQILVYVAPLVLDSLVDELEEATGDQEGVELVVGPLVFAGLDNARETLRRVRGFRGVPAGSPTRRDAARSALSAVDSAADQAEVPSVGRHDRADDLFADFLEAMGLDPGILAAAGGAAGKKTAERESWGREGAGHSAVAGRADAEGPVIASPSEVESSHLAAATGHQEQPDQPLPTRYEPGSLVQQRSRILEHAPGRDGPPGDAGAASSPARVAVAPEPSKARLPGGAGVAGRFVTLIIELRVVEATPDLDAEVGASPQEPAPPTRPGSKPERAKKKLPAHN